MAAGALQLSDKQRAIFRERARLAGLWYVHNQNAPGQGWGGVEQSADTGRFLYEYFPATGVCRGAGIWSQALASAGLLALGQVSGYDDANVFAERARLGLGYVHSLQMFDSRRPASYGAFREHTPQTTWCSCRDGASGCFGLATFARFDNDAESLERAKLFCQWYATSGSHDNKWPHRFFRHNTATAEPCIFGDWQAGGALAYYYTARAAGEGHWLEHGLRPVLEQLLTIGDPGQADGASTGWHGESRITIGNDDFATVAAMAGFVAFDDQRWLDLARRRVAWLLELQDDDGSFPNFGGTFVAALTLLDFVELIELKKTGDDPGPAADALLRAARFGLTVQETDPRDRRAYGGLYGQSNFSCVRDRIHNRSTTYALHLWLRLAGHAAPCLSALGW